MALPDSLKQANETLERLRNRDSRAKLGMQRLEHALVRKAAVATSAGVMGAMRRHGVPNEIKGFPWKMGIWTVATIFEALGKGLVQSVAGGIGDSTLAIYTHNGVATGSLIAGEGNGGEV
jgi:hypothetical protein